MNILFVSNLYPPHHLGGYEIRCQSIADALAKRGHKIHVLTSDNGIDRPERDGDVSRILPYRPYRKRSWIQGGLLAEWEVKQIIQQIIREIQPDVIYLWNMWAIPITAVVTLEQSGIPVVYHIEHNWIIEGLPKDHWIHRWNIRSSRYKNTARNILKPLLWQIGISTDIRQLRLDNVIFVSQYRQNEHITAAFPLGQSHVIYPGVSLQEPRQRTDVNVLKVLCVARFLTPAKGALIAVQALAQVAQRKGVEIYLDIYGDYYPEDPSYTQQLQEIINQIPQISYKGTLPHHEITEVYRHYDALLFASNYPEGMPLVITEAMAVGLPVIGTTPGGAAEVLQPQASLTVPIDDPQAMADALYLLAQDPELWQRLSNGAQDLVRNNFNLERCLNETEAALNAAIKKTS
jgi:glycogen(starch) synthase